MNRKLLASQVEEELMDYILQEPVNVGTRSLMNYNRQMILKLKPEQSCE